MIKISKNTHSIDRRNNMAPFEAQSSIDDTLRKAIEEADPGTMFPLDNPLTNIAPGGDIFYAIFTCPNPACSLAGYLTKKQICGLSTIICGSDGCSAEYSFARNDESEDFIIVFRKSQ
jgi:hypothetical protein